MVRSTIRSADFFTELLNGTELFWQFWGTFALVFRGQGHATIGELENIIWSSSTLVVCRWYPICLEYNKLFYHICFQTTTVIVSRCCLWLFIGITIRLWASSGTAAASSYTLSLWLYYWFCWVSLTYLSGHSVAHAGLLCVWSITSTLEQSLMSPPYFLVSRRFLECQQAYKSLTHNNGALDQVQAQHPLQTKVCHPQQLWE